MKKQHVADMRLYSHSMKKGVFTCTQFLHLFVIFSLLCARMILHWAEELDWNDCKIISTITKAGKLVI